MNKTKSTHYDLLVIGAGSGGLIAAQTAAKLGKRVALIEASDKLGGECLHTGCVPSKSLIYAARTAWSAQQANGVGVNATTVIDYARVRAHILKSIATIQGGHDNDEHYTNLGVKVIHGRASFTGKQTIEVDGGLLSAKRIIIATGSRPAIPDLPGIKDGNYLTNESVFSMQELPESLLVIGGGPIGCELGQAYAMLGSKVTILQSGPRLLTKDEPEASNALLQSLFAMNINVKLNVTITDISYPENSVAITIDGETVHASKLLVATGRQANIPAGMDKAGISCNDHGVIVSKSLRTSNKAVYAIGDCNGGVQFTHAAAEQAGIAIQNALVGVSKDFDAALVPWTTFTSPEIAHFGPLKSTLEQTHTNYSIARIDYTDIDKAISENQDGYIELVVGKRNRVLAATVVGGPAAEMLSRIVATPNMRQLSKSIQAYPTYAVGLRQAALDYVIQKQLSSVPGKFLLRYLKIFR